MEDTSGINIGIVAWIVLIILKIEGLITLGWFWVLTSFIWVPIILIIGILFVIWVIAFLIAGISSFMN